MYSRKGTFVVYEKRIRNPECHGLLRTPRSSKALLMTVHLALPLGSSLTGFDGSAALCYVSPPAGSKYAEVLRKREAWRWSP